MKQDSWILLFAACFCERTVERYHAWTCVTFLFVEKKRGGGESNRGMTKISSRPFLTSEMRLHISVPTLYLCSSPSAERKGRRVSWGSSVGEVQGPPHLPVCLSVGREAVEPVLISSGKIRKTGCEEQLPYSRRGWETSSPVVPYRCLTETDGDGAVVRTGASLLGKFYRYRCSVVHTQ